MQSQVMRDAVGKLFLVVRDHDERLVRPLAEQLDNLTDKAAVTVIETVKGFIKDEEFRVFHKGTSQEAEPLFAAT